ncbi:MAG: Gfo/Idh/MocA family oxidoreductase, partial [Proteobacteria bacterium]|nr:Gfo/Idh/MocA family oxidoreductase [Pseudomonadota bacterium]
MLKFALVGCGRISKRYVDLLCGGQINNASLTAVCDLREDRAQRYQDQGVLGFVDVHQMMRECGDDIDVVCILTERGNHARHCLA